MVSWFLRVFLSPLPDEQQAAVVSSSVAPFHVQGHHLPASTAWPNTPHPTKMIGEMGSPSMSTVDTHMHHDFPVFHRASESGARLAWAGLTPELLEKARGRVRIVAWLMLATLVLGMVFDFVYARLVLNTWDPLWSWAGGIGIGLSLGLALLANNPRVGHHTILKLGLVYEVVLCFLMATIIPWLMFIDVGEVPFVTWVTPLIILFPLIIPSPPHITLITAIAAAATRPLGLLFLEGVVGLEIPGVRYIPSTISPAFAVGLAYVGSRIVHGMSVDLSTAQRMGSYRLETMLGQGGMGEVWRAEHKFLARPAAVKLVRSETMAKSPEHQRILLGRFEREAQATATLRSPHTIALYDFGVAGGGTFYYVMELLDGLDLNDFVERFGPLPPARTAYLLTQICDSLGEAHDCGMIHRDVKPANLYVCRYARDVDFVKVLDFGLVKSHLDGQENDPQLTVDGTVGGTPNFMAPEQILGGDIDRRADIYALGCVAYWMLTGGPVFDGGSVMRTMMMHTQEPPQPPSTQSMLPISDALDRVVLACLEKEPARRPRHVDEVADMLAACDIRDPWTPAQAHAWWDKHLPEREAPRSSQSA